MHKDTRHKLRGDGSRLGQRQREKTNPAGFSIHVSHSPHSCRATVFEQWFIGWYLEQTVLIDDSSWARSISQLFFLCQPAFPVFVSRVYPLLQRGSILNLTQYESVRHVFDWTLDRCISFCWWSNSEKHVAVASSLTRSVYGGSDFRLRFLHQCTSSMHYQRWAISVQASPCFQARRVTRVGGNQLHHHCRKLAGWCNSLVLSVILKARQWLA